MDTDLSGRNHENSNEYDNEETLDINADNQSSFGDQEEYQEEEEEEDSYEDEDDQAEIKLTMQKALSKQDERVFFKFFSLKKLD